MMKEIESCNLAAGFERARRQFCLFILQTGVRLFIETRPFINLLFYEKRRNLQN